MSKKFRTYKQLDLTATAREIGAFWDKEDIFRRSIENRPEDRTFVFYEGPPSANGKPGIHHVLGRTVKDMFNRYKTMRGYRVPRKAGWDTHGLPVELGVEKALGITKEDIGKKISVEAYNEACRQSVMRYTGEWTELTRLMGYWVDLEHPYVTYDPKYMETVWWLLKQIYNQGLLYKGYTIQPYSPKAGTGLSTHELNLPGCYRDIADNTVTAQFRLIKENLPDFLQNIDGDIYFLAWTTTPWTLPSNTALAVGENIDYVLVETFNPYTHKHQFVILAEALLPQILDDKHFYPVETEKHLLEYNPGAKKIPYLVLSRFKGKDLVGLRYEQLLPYAQPYKDADKAFRVISGDFVTTESGTGIVHIAPTFGQDDANAAAKFGVPPLLVEDENGNPVPLVDLQGRFRPEMGEFAHFGAEASLQIHQRHGIAVFVFDQQRGNAELGGSVGVVLAEGGGDVHNAGSAFRGYEITGNYPEGLVGILVGLCVGQQLFVTESDQVFAFETGQNQVRNFFGARVVFQQVFFGFDRVKMFVVQYLRKQSLGQDNELMFVRVRVKSFDQDVIDVFAHGQGGVGRQRPGRGGPGQEVDVAVDILEEVRQVFFD